MQMLKNVQYHKHLCHLIGACSLSYASPLYTQLFLLASLAGLFTNGYFYCACLLHIVVNNDILKRVLKSISKPGHKKSIVLQTAYTQTPCIVCLPNWQ